MTIRLTLRTLLSYLDDTLEPAQAKVIGAKVAESEQARELIERIKQVTRRRRLMTPATSGPGGIDPNTIGEYLDNDVTPEQAAEVEQICLASDVHLAEVAACHQILTLVLGEPALVPPSAKQRMYGLVKGPEAIPSRKPGRSADVNDLSSEIEPDATDETLRMGVPPVGGGRNAWMLVAGGVAIVVLLAFAVYKLVDTGSPPAKSGQIAKVEDNKDKGDQAKDKADTKPTEQKKDAEDAGKKPDVTEVKKDSSSGFVEPKVVAVEPPKTVAIKYAKASDKQTPIGKYVELDKKGLSVLLQGSKIENPTWTHLTNLAEVTSARPLVSLPGSKSVVILPTGVELTLWGNLPEVTLDLGIVAFPPNLLECQAIVHVNDLLDADVTLLRGRLVLRNKADKDANVRVRIDNPTLMKEEHFEIVLHGQDAGVVIERHGQLEPDEPFYEKKDDPKRKGEKIEDPMRKGPTAVMMFYTYGKSADVSAGEKSLSMDADHQPVLYWQSRQGVLEVRKWGSALPAWLKGTPPLKDADSKQARAKTIQAAEEVAAAVNKRAIKVVLAEILDDVQKALPRDMAFKKQAVETLVRGRYALRCMRGIDDVAGLFEIFSQQGTPPPLRSDAMALLQQWLGFERDNDYVLYDVMKKNFRKGESVKMMELFHFISPDDMRKPVTYETLIEGLNNERLPIRALCAFHLYAIVPTGSNIPYDASMEQPERQAAIRAWTKLIPPGQMPQAPKKK